MRTDAQLANRLLFYIPAVAHIPETAPGPWLLSGIDFLYGLPVYKTKLPFQIHRQQKPLTRQIHPCNHQCLPDCSTSNPTTHSYTRARAHTLALSPRSRRFALRHQKLEEEAASTWPSQSGLQEHLPSGPLAAGADASALALHGDGGSREPQQDKPKQHPKPSYLCAVSGLWDSEMQRQPPRLLGLPSQGQAPPLPKLFLPSMLS